MASQRSALIVASYDYEDPGLQRLSAPAHDAETLARVLRDPEIGNFKVRTVLNRPSHVVHRSVEEFFAESKPDDLLMLYFSGPGVKEATGKLYLATADTHLDRLRATSMSAAFVKEQMSRSRSRRVVLLLDNFYAGAFERGLVPKIDDLVDVEEPFGGRGRAVITASRAIEYAFEGNELVTIHDRGPSPFTRAVVEGLRTGEADRDGDGLISMDELYDYVYDRMRTASPNQPLSKWTLGIQEELVIARRGRPTDTSHSIIGSGTLSGGTVIGIEIGEPYERRAKRPRKKSAVRRHVNVSIVSTVDGPPVPTTDNLELSTLYWLRVDIGTLSLESAVVNAPEHPFPDRNLPRSAAGHWLEVLAVSDAATVDQARHWLFLPKRGPSWVCPCLPGGTHRCSKSDRRDHLYLSMTTGRVPVVATLRLSVYYHNNCLQSQLLTMNVGGAPEGVDGYGSFIDYSLTSELESLETLPARSLNIVTNETVSGAHRVIVTGSQQDSFPFTIGDLPLSSLLNIVRTSLVHIHLRQEGTEESMVWKTRYDSEHGKPAKEFEQDLRRLARDGGQLYQEVFPTSEAQMELRSFLREEAQRLREPPIIQVAQASGSRMVLPWQVFYDIPVGNDPEKYVACRFLLDWMHGDMPTVVPATCPYEHPRNTLCPFGFWGFAHIIEVPPSSVNHPLALYVTTDNPPVRLVVGLSDKLDPSLSKKHLAGLVDCLGLVQPGMTSCSSMSKLESSLAGSDIDLVYFYCHGRRMRPEGASSDIPALEIGESERITPMEINSWKSDWPEWHWKRRRPLVVVNGCHTNELTPEEILSFVTAFSDAKAAGVVGTETSIEQGLAGTAMEWFLSSLKQGNKLGEAIYQMRWQLLRKRNLMGLTYTPYCSASLRLRRVA